MDTGTLTGRVTDLTDAPLDPPPTLVATADRIVVGGDTVRLPDPVRTPFAEDGTVTVELAANAGWRWLLTVDTPGRTMPTWTAVIVAGETTRLADVALVDARADDPAPVPVLDRESAAAAAASAELAGTRASAADESAVLAAGHASAAAGSATLAGARASAAAGSASAAAASVTEAQEVLDAAPKWWTGSQAAYDAIPVKSPDTLYLVV